MTEMFKTKGKDNPQEKALDLINVAAKELKSTLLDEDHGCNLKDSLRVVSARYYMEQARIKQEKKVWLCGHIDELLEQHGSDSDEDKELRSNFMRMLVMIIANDEGLYDKGIGFSKSDVWTIVTDHWSKPRPKQAPEAQPLMYSQRPRFQY
jgi:hypothetical protein